MQGNWRGHLKTINHHKWLVFVHCCKAGIYKQGILHDLSKYQPLEFLLGVKYYQGDRSPNNAEREDKGYTSAWLHHKGRNKHHFEYWEDISKTQRFPVFLPYQYIVEAVCDKIAAGMVYNGKDWNQKEPFEYWTNIEKPGPVLKHPATIEFMDSVLKKIADDGLDAGLNPKYLKKMYADVSNKYSKK